MKVRTIDKGIEEWLEAVVRAGQDVDAVADRMVEAGAEVIHQDLVNRVAVDTGALKSHLQQTGKGPVVREGNKHSIEIGLLDLGRVMPAYGTRGPRKGRKQYPREFLYGIILEYGSSSMAAQPYIRPAFDNNRAKEREAELQALRASGTI
jgi:HK97 gp10 family phage protein